MSASHGITCDVSALNEMRALLYDALTQRHAVRTTDAVMGLSSYEMATRVFRRLNQFFLLAKTKQCYFSYPTLLYEGAEEQCVSEPLGLHWSAPAVMHLVTNKKPIVFDDGSANTFLLDKLVLNSD